MRHVKCHLASSGSDAMYHITNRSNDNQNLLLFGGRLSQEKTDNNAQERKSKECYDRREINLFFLAYLFLCKYLSES